MMVEIRATRRPSGRHDWREVLNYGYGVYEPGATRAVRGSVHGCVPGVAVGVPYKGLETVDRGAKGMAEDWARKQGHKVVADGEHVKDEGMFPVASNPSCETRRR